MKLPRAKSAAEETLALHLRGKNLSGFDREFAFAPDRDWRADFAWPAAKLLVEVHGGTTTGGRHVRVVGFRTDRQKMNAAVELGWRVLEYTTEQVVSGEAVRQIERILGQTETARESAEARA